MEDVSQSLKDQGKSRTIMAMTICKFYESQSLKDQGKSRTLTLFPIHDSYTVSQSLKDQGKSRTEGGTSYYRIPSVAIP